MNEKPIDKLESQLEQLIEGAFAKLFRKTISARDIAVEIARSMENQLAHPIGDDGRYIAPDAYIIFLNPDALKNFLNAFPDLSKRLSDLIVDLSSQSGYRLNSVPQVKLLGDGQNNIHQFKVIASHSAEINNSTAAMQAYHVADVSKAVKNPQLIISEKLVVELTSSTINIGRGDQNDVMIDDRYVSRHHLQLRRRFGAYTLFDVQSSGGTRVNNIVVREHRLQSGDVIQIGQTQIIYTDDSHDDATSAGSTQTLDPLP